MRNDKVNVYHDTENMAGLWRLKRRTFQGRMYMFIEAFMHGLGECLPNYYIEECTMWSFCTTHWLFEARWSPGFADQVEPNELLAPGKEPPACALWTLPVGTSHLPSNTTTRSQQCWEKGCMLGENGQRCLHWWLLAFLTVLWNGELSITMVAGPLIFVEFEPAISWKISAFINENHFVLIGSGLDRVQLHCIVPPGLLHSRWIAAQLGVSNFFTIGKEDGKYMYYTNQYKKCMSLKTRARKDYTFKYRIKTWNIHMW